MPAAALQGAEKRLSGKRRCDKHFTLKWQPSSVWVHAAAADRSIAFTAGSHIFRPYLEVDSLHAGVHRRLVQRLTDGGQVGRRREAATLLLPYGAPQLQQESQVSSWWAACAWGEGDVAQPSQSGYIPGSCPSSTGAC